MLGGRADGAAASAGAGAGAVGGGAPRGGDDFDAGGHDEPSAPGAGPEISDEDIPF
jgi:hypothetical protein